MAVTYDQQQGLYTVEKPKPIKVKTPNYNWNLLNNQAKYSNYKKLKAEADKTNKQNEAQYKTDLAQAEQWNREDKLLKEEREREDSALQRWTEDARLSGINPNLAIGAQGAPTGGGYTNATPKDYTLQNTVLQGELDRVLEAIKQEFQAEENAKDRWTRLVQSLSFANAFQKEK